MVYGHIIYMIFNSIELAKELCEWRTMEDIKNGEAFCVAIAIQNFTRFAANGNLIWPRDALGSHGIASEKDVISNFLFNHRETSDISCLFRTEWNILLITFWSESFASRQVLESRFVTITTAYQGIMIIKFKEKL